MPTAADDLVQSIFRSAPVREVMLSLLLVAAVFGTYYKLSSVITALDSIWSVPLSLSLIKEGNLDLDEYAVEAAERLNYGVVEVAGHLRSYFPLGTPLLTTPMVWAIDLVYRGDLSKHYNEVELIVASFLAGLTALVMYGIGRLYLTRARSLVLVAIFAFCTSAWSTASRALWQHGPSMLMLAIALYLFLLAEERPQLVQYAAIPLACAYVIRPTNSISIVFLTALVFVQHRRYFVRYLLWASAVAVPFLALNHSMYGSFLSPYYAPSRIGANPDFWEALAGNLVSPARGLLIYSPVFLLSGYGVILKARRGELTGLDVALSCIVVVHWLVISSFAHWWGGFSYGPRFFTDMVPYLIYFLIPVISSLGAARTPAGFVVGCCFVCLVGWSFYAHYVGAMYPILHTWNVGLEENLARLWDWRAPPFIP